MVFVGTNGTLGTKLYAVWDLRQGLQRKARKRNVVFGTGERIY